MMKEQSLKQKEKELTQIVLPRDAAEMSMLAINEERSIPIVTAIGKMQDLVRNYKIEFTIQKKKQILRDIGISGFVSSIFSWLSTIISFVDLQTLVNRGKEKDPENELYTNMGNLLMICYVLLAVELFFNIQMFMLAKREHDKNDIDIAEKSFQFIRCNIICNDFFLEGIQTTVQFIIVFNVDLKTYGGFIMSVLFSIINFAVSVYELLEVNNLKKFLQEQETLLAVGKVSSAIDDIFDDEPDEASDRACKAWSSLPVVNTRTL